jgi:hypothetical protein
MRQATAFNSTPHHRNPAGVMAMTIVADRLDWVSLEAAVSRDTSHRPTGKATPEHLSKGSRPRPGQSHRGRETQRITARPASALQRYLQLRSRGETLVGIIVAIVTFANHPYPDWLPSLLHHLAASLSH